MDLQKLRDLLKGTIDPNLRQEAEDELTKVRLIDKVDRLGYINNGYVILIKVRLYCYCKLQVIKKKCIVK